MHAYSEKLKAAKLYLQYESHATVINELQYLSRMALRNSIEAYRIDGVQRQMTQTPKYTEEQKQAVVTHQLEQWFIRIEGLITAGQIGLNELNHTTQPVLCIKKVVRLIMRHVRVSLGGKKMIFFR